MSRVAATEWGKDGINVNVVCPLAWTAKLEQFKEAYPDAFKANVKMPPMGHYGNAETEIGRVCVQLAMPDFKYMSGETLTLEGGMGQRRLSAGMDGQARAVQGSLSRCVQGQRQDAADGSLRQRRD